MVVRIFAVLALVALAGCSTAQAQGPVYRLVRSQGWLWGPGYHAYTCCNCPGYGNGSIYPPSMLPYEAVPTYEQAEPVVAPPRVGQLTRRYPIGYYPLMGQQPQTPVPPQGAQPIHLPLVNWNEGPAVPDAGVQGSSCTAAHPSVPWPSDARR